MKFQDIPMNTGTLIGLLHAYTYTHRKEHKHVCIFLSPEDYNTIKEQAITVPASLPLRIQGAEVHASLYQERGEIRIYSE